VPSADPNHRFASAPQGHGLRRVVKGLLASLIPRRLVRPAPPAIRILTYHRVNDSHPGDRLSVPTAAFSRQMEALAESGHPVVTLAEVAEALRGTRSLATGAVALTFDDGFRDNLEHAFPVLERHGFKASFFIPTALIGGDTPIERYLGCCADDGLMSWGEIRELAAAGQDVGGHGRTHVELASVAESRARDEIQGSRDDIRDQAGLDAAWFCYPRGSESPGVRRLVAEAGYTGACTVRPGANAADVDLFGLLRTEIAADDDAAELRRKLAGAYDGWHLLIQGFKRMKSAPAVS